MYNELIIFLKVVAAAFCGYIFSEHLTKAGQIANPLYMWLQEKLSPQNEFWYDICNSKFRYLNPEYIFKPLIGCFRCVCGQWALWTYFVQTIIYGASDFNFFHLCAYALIGVAAGIISHKFLNDE